MSDIPPERTDVEKQHRDSDIVFTAVAQACKNLEDAKLMVMHFYLPDERFSRAGISHALGRLENHYEGQTPPPDDVL